MAPYRRSPRKKPQVDVDKKDDKNPKKNSETSESQNADYTAGAPATQPEDQTSDLSEFGLDPNRLERAEEVTQRRHAIEQNPQRQWPKVSQKRAGPNLPHTNNAESTTRTKDTRRTAHPAARHLAQSRRNLQRRPLPRNVRPRQREFVRNLPHPEDIPYLVNGALKKYEGDEPKKMPRHHQDQNKFLQPRDQGSYQPGKFSAPHSMKKKMTSLLRPAKLRSVPRSAPIPPPQRYRYTLGIPTIPSRDTRRFEDSSRSSRPHPQNVVRYEEPERPSTPHANSGHFEEAERPSTPHPNSGHFEEADRPDTPHPNSGRFEEAELLFASYQDSARPAAHAGQSPPSDYEPPLSPLRAPEPAFLSHRSSWRVIYDGHIPTPQVVDKNTPRGKSNPEFHNWDRDQPQCKRFYDRKNLIMIFGDTSGWRSRSRSRRARRKITVRRYEGASSESDDDDDDDDDEPNFKFIRHFLGGGRSDKPKAPEADESIIGAFARGFQSTFSGKSKRETRISREMPYNDEPGASFALLGSLHANRPLSPTRSQQGFMPPSVPSQMGTPFAGDLSTLSDSATLVGQTIGLEDTVYPETKEEEEQSFEDELLASRMSAAEIAAMEGASPKSQEEEKTSFADMLLGSRMSAAEIAAMNAAASSSKKPKQGGYKGTVLRFDDTTCTMYQVHGPSHPSTPGYDASLAPAIPTGTRADGLMSGTSGAEGTLDSSAGPSRRPLSPVEENTSAYRAPVRSSDEGSSAAATAPEEVSRARTVLRVVRRTISFRRGPGSGENEKKTEKSEKSKKP